MARNPARSTLDSNPQILELIAEGSPLPLACRVLGLPTKIADRLRELPEVDRALALREAKLRRTFETAKSKDERDSAKTLLERDFAWRPVAAKSIEESFAAILSEFAELEPAAYAVLRTLIDRNDASAAERRRRHAKGT